MTKEELLQKCSKLRENDIVANYKKNYKAGITFCNDFCSFLNNINEYLDEHMNAQNQCLIDNTSFFSDIYRDLAYLKNYCTDEQIKGEYIANRFLYIKATLSHLLVYLNNIEELLNKGFISHFLWFQHSIALTGKVIEWNSEIESYSYRQLSIQLQYLYVKEMLDKTVKIND